MNDDTINLEKRFAEIRRFMRDIEERIAILEGKKEAKTAKKKKKEKEKYLWNQ